MATFRTLHIKKNKKNKDYIVKVIGTTKLLTGKVITLKRRFKKPKKQ